MFIAVLSLKKLSVTCFKALDLLFIQDGHEICFVGDEAFRELSQMDPEGEKLLKKVNILKIKYS